MPGALNGWRVEPRCTRRADWLPCREWQWATYSSEICFRANAKVAKHGIRAWVKEDIHYTCLRGSSVATGGGKRGNLPPPQPPIRHPVRSMQIRGDFHVEKMGVGLQDLLPRFTCTDGGRSLALRLRKKRSFRGCWRSFFSSPSVKHRGPLVSFNPGIGPPSMTFFIYFLNFQMWIWGPSQKKVDQIRWVFRFWRGAGWQVLRLPPPPLRNLATPMLSGT